MNKSKKIIIIITIIAVILGGFFGFYINKNKTTNLPKAIKQVNVVGRLNTQAEYLKEFNFNDDEIKDIQKNKNYSVIMYQVEIHNNSKKELTVTKIKADSKEIELHAMNPAEKIVVSPKSKTTKYIIVAMKNNDKSTDEIIEYLKENTSFSIRGK